MKEDVQPSGILHTCTQEANAGGSLQPKSLRPASQSNTVRSHFKKTQNDRQTYDKVVNVTYQMQNQTSMSYHCTLPRITESVKN
jgi:hypothetical protein